MLINSSNLSAYLTWKLKENDIQRWRCTPEHQFLQLSGLGHRPSLQQSCIQGLVPCELYELFSKMMYHSCMELRRWPKPWNCGRSGDLSGWTCRRMCKVHGEWKCSNARQVREHKAGIYTRLQIAHSCAVIGILVKPLMPLAKCSKTQPPWLDTKSCNKHSNKFVPTQRHLGAKY